MHHTTCKTTVSSTFFLFQDNTLIAMRLPIMFLFSVESILVSNHPWSASAKRWIIVTGPVRAVTNVRGRLPYISDLVTFPTNSHVRKIVWSDCCQDFFDKMELYSEKDRSVPGSDRVSTSVHGESGLRADASISMFRHQCRRTRDK